MKTTFWLWLNLLSKATSTKTRLTRFHIIRKVVSSRVALKMDSLLCGNVSKWLFRAQTPQKAGKHAPQSRPRESASTKSCGEVIRMWLAHCTQLAPQSSPTRFLRRKWRITSKWFKSTIRPLKSVSNTKTRITPTTKLWWRSAWTSRALTAAGNTLCSGMASLCRFTMSMCSKELNC